MSSQPDGWDVIDRRVANALGPEWETGGVFDVDANSVICPRHTVDTKKSWFSMLWATVEDAEVARGAGQVIAVGQASGWDFTHSGALDSVLSSIREEIANPRAPKRSLLSRVFGR